MANRGQVSRLIKDERGGVALLFGLALPLLGMGAAAAVEYASLTRQSAQLQKAADTAAVAATKELTLVNTTDANVASVARAMALSSLAASGSADAANATITSEVLNQRTSVRVTLVQPVTNLMGKLLSLPLSELSAKATARLSGSTRLCVLTLDPSSSATVQMDRTSKLSAPQCSVYSNSGDPTGLVVKDTALITAERICTVGGYSGSSSSFSTTPLTGCPSHQDPLLNRAPPSSGGCDYNNLVIRGETRTLNPGVYCGGLKVTNGSQVTLAQGEYIIDGASLVVDGGSSLTGDYVGFYFRGAVATLKFASDTTINLSAPKLGALAGILFFEDRSAPLLRDFVISSDNARRLLGTIYLSRGALRVDANKPVSDQSAYTVIVSRQLRLTAGPNLVLNAMYTSTDVPVPDGVGPNGSAVSLSQ